MNFRPYRPGIKGGIVKIYTQSKSVNSGGTDVQGYIVHSDHATGIVTTDAAGDATVPVEMNLYAPDTVTGVPAGPGGAGPGSTYYGTATLYADGSAAFVINGQG